MIKRFLTLGLIAVVAFATLTGCEGLKWGAVEKSAPPEVNQIWPLLGVEDSSYKNNPVIAVKIEGSTEARPYYGINQADIVVQERAEGGIARFIGIFNSQFPKRVEPVRSIRMMDGPILGQLKATLFCSGGQWAFFERAFASGLEVYGEDHGEKGYSRDSDRYAPHNLQIDLSVASTKISEDYAKFAGTPYFSYAANLEASTPYLSGVANQDFKTEISPGYWTHWTWNETEKKYYAAEEDTNSLDADGEPLTTENVVTIKVDDRDVREIDPNLAFAIENLVIGDHKGTINSGGKVIDVTITKKSEKEPFEFKAADGTTPLLAPGRSYIVIEAKEGNL
ncbi:MAG: DUF3048 domain-containing protein [Bifidobacteriaceae bacterium]|jgi:hypothetical protein|nr:DUF3048 domain-containing protein [Bifidobacteriaceae bacterium]